jgi:hypothetical protein
VAIFKYLLVTKLITFNNLSSLLENSVKLSNKFSLHNPRNTEKASLCSGFYRPTLLARTTLTTVKVSCILFSVSHIVLRRTGVFNTVWP